MEFVLTVGGGGDGATQFCNARCSPFRFIDAICESQKGKEVLAFAATQNNNCSSSGLETEAATSYSRSGDNATHE